MREITIDKDKLVQAYKAATDEQKQLLTDRNGEFFIIVDKRGKDIFECSLEAERQGRDKAIEPGEPCELVRRDYVPVYRKLGREGFLAWLRDESADHSLEAAYEYAGLKQRKSKK